LKKLSLFIVYFFLAFASKAQVIPVFPVKPTDGDKKSDAKPKPKVVYKEKIIYRDKPVESTGSKVNPEPQNNLPAIEMVNVGNFSIGKYEVTQAQWVAVMGSNPSYFKGDNLPVEQVSWDDVQIFIQKLNTLTGKKYRLPTESEWEFAAKGGIQSHGYNYAGSNDLSVVAWYEENSVNTTQPVGQKQPNELSIYDLSGNVEEWVNDLWGDKAFGFRVYRGGSWIRTAAYCLLTYRCYGNHSLRSSFLGFRMVSSE